MNIINGDCIQEMKKLDDESVDLLFCDLPYGQTKCKWDCLIDLNLFWEQVNRICKKTTPMFFTCTTRFGVSLINSNPKNFRYDMVWEKSKKVGFLSAKKMPLRNHEMIYVFYRKLPLYDVSHHTKRELNASHISYSNIYGSYKPGPRIMYEPPLPVSVLKFNSQRGKHSTHKPFSLMEWILRYYSKENDVILDPTMGSGSTGIVCQNMGRFFIGIEKDKDIYDDAKNRLENNN